jgi:hypothetical protein
MTRSVRLRFALVGVFTAILAAAGLGAAVQGLFERHVEREMLAELDADLRFLARSIAVEDGAATLKVAPLPDPRFQEPLSGLYWQIRNDRTGSVLHSPSLAGATFSLEPDSLRPGERHRHIVRGPEGTKMVVLERRIDEAAEPMASYRVAVAVDRKLLEAANRAFVLDLLPTLAGIAAGLLGAFALQGGIALWPIARAPCPRSWRAWPPNSTRCWKPSGKAPAAPAKGRRTLPMAFVPRWRCWPPARATCASAARRRPRRRSRPSRRASMAGWRANWRGRTSRARPRRAGRWRCSRSWNVSHAPSRGCREAHISAGGWRCLRTSPARPRKAT